MVNAGLVVNAEKISRGRTTGIINITFLLFSTSPARPHNQIPPEYQPPHHGDDDNKMNRKRERGGDWTLYYYRLRTVFYAKAIVLL